MSRDRENALQSLLANFQDDGGANEYLEKTASEQDEYVSDFQSALDDFVYGQEKTASEQDDYTYEDGPYTDLEKIAEDLSELDQAALEKEASFYGATMADAFVDRLSQYDGLLDSFEGDYADQEKIAEDIAEYSSDAGWEDGLRLGQYALESIEQAYLEKVAYEQEQEYYDDEEEYYEDDDYEKTAEEESFEVGYEEGHQEMLEKIAYASEDEGYNDGYEYALEKIAEEQEYNEGYEYGLGYFEGEKVAALVAQGFDDEMDEEEFLEKTSSDNALESYEAGFENGLDWIEKTAEDLGGYDFVFEVAEELGL